jgi:hypothetical protein
MHQAGSPRSRRAAGVGRSLLDLLLDHTSTVSSSSCQCRARSSASWSEVQPEPSAAARRASEAFGEVERLITQPHFDEGGFQITGASRFRTPGQFAGDVTRLADERRDLELRELVNELHFDLLILRGDDDDG